MADGPGPSHRGPHQGVHLHAPPGLIGWPSELTRKCLRETDGFQLAGTLWDPFVKRRYYRHDRVLQAIEVEGVRAALAEARRRRVERTGCDVTLDALAGLPLALDVGRLKARGWSDRLINRFLGAPDGVARRGSRKFRLYVATRVEQVEATVTFREAWERETAPLGVESPAA